MAKLLIILIAVIGTISAYVRKYEYDGRNNNLLHLISHPKSYGYGKKFGAERFRSSFGGESVHGVVGLNSFSSKEVMKSKYDVGDDHDEYSKP
ncbi:hypothetical protein HA402_004038 [Bradysia odoriphaga]|nr:hypothetical protein HA402_004038 [Bradysia odoriphaga]